MRNAPTRPTTRKKSYPDFPAVTRISSFDQNPANGKIPASASVPIMNVQNVIGMNLRSPPMSFFMSKEWCEPEWLTDPAPRKSSALKNAWVKRWNTAATQAPDAERHHHVAELRDGRVREDLLDVVLHEREHGPDDDGDPTDQRP